MREAFALTLEDQGLAVLQAGSAERGLELLERHAADLVVTDFSLPGQDGAWMLREAHRRGLLRGDPLIVTAHARAAIGTGFTVLQKPVELDDFVAAVMGRLKPSASAPHRRAEVLFALDACASARLTAQQFEQSVAIATRAAGELTHAMQAGLYRRIEQGLSILYRFDRALGAVTVLEVRPGNG